MTGADVEFLDADGDRPGSDEDLDPGAGGGDRHRRWPLVLVVLLLAAAVTAAVVTRSGERPSAARSPSATTSTAVAPLPHPVPLPQIRVVVPAPRCPAGGDCRVAGVRPAVLAAIRTALRPAIPQPRRLTVQESHRPDGRLVQRVITAIGDTRTVVVSVSRVGDRVAPRTIERGEQSYQISLVRRGLLVTVQIGDPAGLEGGGIPTAALRVASDRRVRP